jgi:hypothetical protein
VLVIIACSSNLLYYADGTVFAYVIATGEPYELLWSEYPLRLGSFVLTGGPALLLKWIRIENPFVLGWAYQATFLMLPLWSIALSYAQLPRDHRGWVFWPALFLASLGMSTFGFPTEIWVTGSVFWPLAAMLLNPPAHIGGLFLSAMLAALFCFSHEVAALTAPCLLWAAWQGWKRSSGTQRRLLLIVLGELIACGSVWIWIYLSFEHRNPLIAQALAENQGHLFGLKILSPAPLLAGMTIALAIVLALELRPWRRIIPVRWMPGMWILVVGALVAIAIPVRPTDHYLARGVVAFLLMPVGIVAVRRFAGGIRPLSQRILVLVVLCQLFAQSVFVAYWGQYRSALVETISQTTGRIGSTFYGMAGPHRRSPGSPRPPVLLGLVAALPGTHASRASRQARRSDRRHGLVCAIQLR